MKEKSKEIKTKNKRGEKVRELKECNAKHNLLKISENPYATDYYK